MTAYRVTYSTKTGVSEPHSFTAAAEADDVPGALATADARVLLSTPDWLREIYFVSAVVPVESWTLPMATTRLSAWLLWSVPSNRHAAS